MKDDESKIKAKQSKSQQQQNSQISTFPSSPTSFQHILHDLLHICCNNFYSTHSFDLLVTNCQQKGKRNQSMNFITK